jgi:hypothetical protein
MNRYAQKRGGGEFSKAYLVVALGIVLLVIGLVGKGCEARANRVLDERLTALEQARTETIATVEQAQAEVNTNSVKFARHWSSGYKEGLGQAKATLNSQIIGLLERARQAQADRDRAGANAIADDVEAAINRQLELPNRILGPPSLYSELARKDASVDSHIDTVQLEITQAYTDVVSLKDNAWNKAHGVAFGRSYRRLSEAILQLQRARNTLGTMLVNDNVEHDRPLAYDEANAASAMVAEAWSWAETDAKLAKEAWAEIEQAQRDIDDAQAYIDKSWYRAAEAQRLLDSGARQTLSSAREAFAAENYTGDELLGAKELALQAQREADAAWRHAATPTPTPTPTHTPTVTPTPEPTNTPQPYEPDDDDSPSISVPSIDTNDDGGIYDGGGGGDSPSDGNLYESDPPDDGGLYE